jgi:hypothetical protein
LYLDHTEITDAGLVNLEGLLGLEFLDLRGTGITDTGLQHLQGLTRLKELDLGINSPPSAAGIATLQKKRPSLKINYW